MKLDLETLLDGLWNQYTSLNPQAEAIANLLENRGDRVVNDHVAFRTFRHPKVGLDRLAKVFLDLGYRSAGEYHFPVKRLFARHFEGPNPDDPKVFISELLTDTFSSTVQEIIKDLLIQVDPEAADEDAFLYSGRPWDTISRRNWRRLRRESEYAAWVAAFGYGANHFTVLVNALQSVSSLAELNELLKAAGFALKEEGGEIKGGPEVYLAQSSTVAAPVTVHFADGPCEIPGCYYEFAQRYPLPSGELFQGFVAASANRIFESTNAGPGR